MKQINVYQAKTQLSKLLQEALDGEDIVIARDGVPLVRLVPVEKKGQSLLGLVPGIWMAEDFDAPMEDFADYR